MARALALGPLACPFDSTAARRLPHSAAAIAVRLVSSGVRTGTIGTGTIGTGAVGTGTVGTGTVGTGTVGTGTVVGANIATIIGRARCRCRVEGVRAVCAGALRLNDGPCSVLARRRRVVAQVCDHTESHDESAHYPDCLASHRNLPRGF